MGKSQVFRHRLQPVTREQTAGWLGFWTVHVRAGRQVAVGLWHYIHFFPYPTSSETGTHNLRPLTATSSGKQSYSSCGLHMLQRLKHHIETCRVAAATVELMAGEGWEESKICAWQASQSRNRKKASFPELQTQPRGPKPMAFSSCVNYTNWDSGIGGQRKGAEGMSFHQPPLEIWPSEWEARIVSENTWAVWANRGEWVQICHQIISKCFKCFKNV